LRLRTACIAEAQRRPTITCTVVIWGSQVKGKKPGPFGKGQDNFKCEYAKETLSVSKIEYTSDKKCFYVFKTDCKYEYAKGKDIGYKKECSEFSVTKVRKITLFNITLVGVCVFKANF
jgi:hypothetical protein